MNQPKPIHGEPVPFWRQHGLQPAPPIPCALKLGDVVTLTNENGGKFPGLRVVGFRATANGIEPSENHPRPGLVGHFIHINSGAWWFPHRPDELTKETA